MEMSNRSLALLLVAAVIVNLGGTMVSLNKLNHQGVTGLALGEVELSITTNASCAVLTNISFGTGSPQALTLSTDTANSPYNNCATSNLCQGLVINNTGNVNLNVSMQSNVTGSTLLAGQSGAADSEFQWTEKSGNVTATTANGTFSGCMRLLTSNYSWYPVNTSANPICYNLTFAKDADAMTAEFNITIEPTLPPGPRSAGLTVTCAQNS